MLLTLLSGCGYQILSDYNDNHKISIGSIEGDNDGLLAQSIITEIAKTPSISYTDNQSKYFLNVHILSVNNSHSDYQYQTGDTEENIINRLSPVESKYDIVLRVELSNSINGKKISGPVEIRHTLFYDYFDYRSYSDQTFEDNLGAWQTTLAYSLGQLASEDDAKMSAKKLAYKKLGQKIAQYLVANLNE